MPTERFIFGAGGHAKVVLDALHRLGLDVHVVDDDPAKVGTRLLGVEVEPTPAATLLPLGHLAVGDNRVRMRLLEDLEHRIDGWFSVLHPLASIAASARLESGVFVAAHAVVGPEADIATATIVNHGAVVDHDCRIGHCCHIAPHATLAGGVCIGDGVLIGSGAVVLPGVVIGDNAIIGAGAVVNRHVAAGTTVVGVPARVRD